MKRHINAQRGREKLNHAVKALNTINMFAVQLNEAEVADEQGNAPPIQITRYENVKYWNLLHRQICQVTYFIFHFRYFIQTTVY